MFFHEKQGIFIIHAQFASDETVHYFPQMTLRWIYALTVESPLAVIKPKRKKVISMC